MKNKKTSMKTIGAALCVIFLIAAFVVQFFPFWTMEESVSIAGYVWFPTDHGDLTTYFQQNIASDFDAGNLALYSIVQMLVPIAAIVLALSLESEIWLAIGAGVTGISGIWSVLGKAALRAGNFWPVMLVISILLILAAILLVCAPKQETAGDQ